MFLLTTQDHTGTLLYVTIYWETALCVHMNGVTNKRSGNTKGILPGNKGKIDRNDQVVHIFLTTIAGRGDVLGHQPISEAKIIPEFLLRQLCSIKAMRYSANP